MKDDRMCKFAGLINALVRARVRRSGGAAVWNDADDLRQEAWLAALQAQRTAEHVEVLNDESYCARAARLAMGHFVVEMGSPVSARSHADRPKLIGITRAEVNPDLRIETPLHDAQLEDLELRGRVRARIARLLADDPTLKAGLMVRYQNLTPREVATQLGVTVEDVYQSRRRLRNLVLGDDDLRQCWEGLRA